MKFIHIGDLHCNKERLPYCLKTFEIIIEKLQELKDKVPVLITGDLWDSVLSNGTVFYSYLTKIKALADLTSVYIIYGTPTHDIEGSLDVFKQFGVKVFRNNTYLEEDDFELVAIPEPRKCDYISASQEKIKESIRLGFDEFISSLPKKNKTRIVMYHGDIQGAEAVYQNSYYVTSSTFGITLNQLQKLNADAYCFGHIHIPQKINGLNNAYYCGSCYPVNSGEHHNPSYNIISIEGKKVSVEAISFGFPYNVTKEYDIENIKDIYKENFKGVNLTVKVTLETLLKKNYSKINLEEDIKKHTQAESVKVVFEYIKKQSLRNKEISEQISAVEKFKKYAKSMKIKTSSSIISKLEDIQNGLITEKFIPSEKFELTYLSLKGAIGIKDGQGKEEIHIDFKSFPDGLIALTGKTGAGKSTIIENCHPFPQMLTRAGTLKEHFMLKDSHRILIYKTSSGKEVKISMLIDGVNKTASSKFFVETRDCNGSWQALKSCDGTMTPYLEFVEHNFGSLQLFLRTSFYAKEQIKGIPDLSKATKSEKMQLFSALAGTDYLSEISERAKILKKEYEKQKDELKGKYAGFDNIIERIHGYENEICQNQTELEKEKKLLEIDNETLKVYRSEQQKYDTKIMNIKFIETELSKKNSEKTEQERLYLKYSQELIELKEQIENIDTYKEQLKWIDDNTPILNDLKIKKTEISEKVKKLRDIVSQKELIISNEKEKKNALEKQLFEIETDIKTLEESVFEVNEICPVCGNHLSSEKSEELLKKQNEIKEQIKKRKKSLKECKNNIQKHKDIIEENLTDKDVEQLVNLSDEENKLILSINEINSVISSIDVAEIKSIIKYVEPRYKEVEKDFESVKLKIGFLTKDIETLEKELQELPKNYRNEIEKLELNIYDSKEKISMLNADIKVLKDNLNSLNKYKSDIDTLVEKMSAIDKNIKEYEIIQDSFGNNGIQAIELDSAAPEISDITNVILKETFGDRFSISFDTQRDTKDGRKIDDFIINVFDSESGREKTLPLLSSGESVLIKQALYYAFSVIRTRKTGFCFQTRFLDESDSSLDTSLRPKYVRMVEAAHKLCNATQTILITHSQEIKDIVQNKIEL